VDGTVDAVDLDLHPTADLAAAVGGEKPPIEIARNRFGLHRAINDRALHHEGQGVGVARAP
jgi:hypothetical protein